MSVMPSISQAFFFTEVLSTVNEGLDKVVDALPIPNQPAKVGITVIGGLIVFGLVKQVVNTVLFFGALAGIGYLLVNKDDDEEKKSSKDSSSSSSSTPPSSNPNDPMAEVDRIMDKYK